MKGNTFWGLCCALLIVLALLAAATPSQAADVQAADFNCDTVAQANGIEVYFCEGDDGPPFLMNGYGFMTVVE